MKIDSQQFHDLQELHCFAADASLEVHRKRIMELWAMDTPQGRSFLMDVHGFRWIDYGILRERFNIYIWSECWSAALYH
jgi:hypothetical protein